MDVKIAQMKAKLGSVAKHSKCMTYRFMVTMPGRMGRVDTTCKCQIQRLADSTFGDLYSLVQSDNEVARDRTSYLSIKVRATTTTETTQVVGRSIRRFILCPFRFYAKR